MWLKIYIKDSYHIQVMGWSPIDLKLKILHNNKKRLSEFFFDFLNKKCENKNVTKKSLTNSRKSFCPFSSCKLNA